MKHKYCFIIGLLTPLLIIPLITDLVAIINCISEYLVSCISVKIIVNNAIIEKENNKDNCANAIGFCAPVDDDDDYDDDDT